MLFFSPIDDNNNAFNVSDIKDFNKNAQFFRILFTHKKYLAQFYDYKKKKFKKLKIRIDEKSKNTT